MKMILAGLTIAYIWTGWAIAPPPREKFYLSVRSKMDTAAVDKYGDGVSVTIADYLEGQISNALREQFPCIDLHRESDLPVLLGWEKDRQLLGVSDDPGRVAAIGNGLGARYLLIVNVTMTGSKTFLTGSAMDSKSVRTLSRQAAQGPGGEDALDQVEQFAKQFAASLAGGIPKCPAGFWSGTFSMTLTRNHTSTNSAGKKIQETGQAQLSCTLSGRGNDARCSYSGSSADQGPGGTITYTKNGPSAEIGFVVRLEGDKLEIGLGDLEVEVTVKDTMGTPNLGTYMEKMHLGDYLLPAGPDERKQSGSWTNPNPLMKELGLVEKVTWSLSR